MKLRTKDIKYIVLHTADFKGACGVDIIKEWHLVRDFDTCGYHRVVTGSWFDDKAEVQMGRADKYVGAHALGRNGDSLGICVTGSGDDLEWTDVQIDLLSKLCVDLMVKYDIPISRIIGHRDTFLNKLNPRKSCPGKLINMKEIRKFIMREYQSQFHMFPYEESKA